MSEQIIEKSTPIAEIDHGPTAFEKFLDAHQKKLIIAGIVVIIVLGAFLVSSEMKKSYHAKAGAAFAAAQDMPALRQVADTYADTPAAGSALLKLSQMQWQNSEQKKSIETLENLISTFPEHPLVTSATAALASHQLELGELDKAVANFEKVVANEDHLALAPLALLSLGDIARRNGKIEEARKYYEEIKSEKYSQIAYSSISAANERIALLGVAKPEKDTPKAAEEPAASPTDQLIPSDAPSIEAPATIPSEELPVETPVPAEIPAPEDASGSEETPAPVPAETSAPESENTDSPEN